MNETNIFPSGFYSDDGDLLKKQIENLKNTDQNIDLSPYSYIFNDPHQVKKQTEAKHEIFISLTANILENIEGSVFPESKQVVSNNYYIPVPSGHDHNKYLSSFFEYLENCMSSSAQQETLNRDT
jgi:hypothetical protein